MKHGFVYILGNVAMPGLYKIGHTTSSPFERAQQLSRASGVPIEFTVLGFVAFSDPARYETELHQRFSDRRATGREFFKGPLRDLWAAMIENDERQAVCDCEIAPWSYEEEHGR